MTELSHVVQVRAEGPKAPSPGQRPGYVGNQQGALKGQKLYVLSGVFKAFALSGRQVCVRNYPGRCPGLGASALSGRLGLTFRACGAYFQGVWGLLSGRVELTFLDKFTRNRVAF